MKLCIVIDFTPTIAKDLQEIARMVEIDRQIGTTPDLEIPGCMGQLENGTNFDYDFRDLPYTSLATMTAEAIKEKL